MDVGLSRRNGCGGIRRGRFGGYRFGGSFDAGGYDRAQNALRDIAYPSGTSTGGPGREHVRRLTERYSNAEAAHADLTAAYDAFAGSFAPSLVQGAGKGVADLAGANARSRLRMTALYYFAGLNNLLVAGTGNKIEDFGVGFFTKYGDGGVDISPIADLTKTEVYELGRWLRVPEAILVAPPTDGLFGDDRTDEQQIGATYPELERAMAHAERGTDPALLSGREREVYDIFLRRNRANRHKMEPIPVCRIPRHLVEPAGR